MTDLHCLAFPPFIL